MVFQSPMANIDAMYQQGQSYNVNFNSRPPQASIPPPPPPPGTDDSPSPLGDTGQYKRKAFNFRKWS